MILLGSKKWGEQEWTGFVRRRYRLKNRRNVGTHSEDADPARIGRKKDPGETLEPRSTEKSRPRTDIKILNRDLEFRNQKPKRREEREKAQSKTRRQNEILEQMAEGKR